MVDREPIVAARIDEIGRDSFPDDDVAWRVLGIRDVGAYCFAEADATPPTVGYPRFRFVLRFETESQFLLVGCYAWIEDRWTVLFTSTGAPTDWQAIAPKESRA